ncbi:SGNH/GDSL hydrolase family protein [Fulvivirgaceae bacterium BMA12]|uniref:SGNH/GDSL hydrolase family protein n=1 Tax=Agaribacillus aureus TaxID=3051825 RepID=A0ABT8LDW9_9BACT|nr:SGNH/GDSL hydrolase family protein [Fulvivirgaceae bacterium BMA12]
MKLSKQKFKSVLKNLATVVISTIVSLIVILILLEVYLRIFEPPAETPGYTITHPTRRYQLKPDFTGKTYDAVLQVNSHGLRDFERPINLDSNNLRVTVFGDSFTFGIGVNHEETFTKILEKNLQNQHRQNVQVFNFGIPSYNTVQEELYLKEVYDQYLPDVVIFMFYAGNDTNLLEPVNSMSGINSYALIRASKDIMRRLYAYNWLARRYYSMIYMLKYGGEGKNDLEARINHDSNLFSDDFEGWQETQRSFKRIVEFCKAKKVKLGFAIIANHTKLGRSYDEDPMKSIVEKIYHALSEADVKFIIRADEAYREFTNQEHKLWVKPKDTHFSKMANKKLGDFLYPWVESIIQDPSDQ